jgi:SAM-dependent methyltransferase
VTRASFQGIRKVTLRSSGSGVWRRRALPATSRRTLRHYENRAEAFWEGTRDHDVSQNIRSLLEALPAVAPLRILDVGCGPGRDLATLKQLGHLPTGLDGCRRFAAMARAHSGAPVWRQDFQKLRLPGDAFDGVFANASLFHIPTKDLPRVIGQLTRALIPGGALFCSNPRGDGREGWNGDRYGSYLDLEHWRALFHAAGLIELSHYYRPPGLPRAEQPWLAMVWRKPI